MYQSSADLGLRVHSVNRLISSLGSPFFFIFDWGGGGGMGAEAAIWARDFGTRQHNSCENRISGCNRFYL